MTHVVAGYAPSSALPGFPALFGRLKEVFDLVVQARSALAAGSTSEVERHLAQIFELLSSFNLMAMCDAALQSVEIFAHPLSLDKIHGSNQIWLARLLAQPPWWRRPYLICSS
jgi:hypothetical protein